MNSCISSTICVQITMRPLHWEKLKSIEGTIWETFSDTDTLDGEAKERLEVQFSAKKVQKQAKKKHERTGSGVEILGACLHGGCAVIVLCACECVCLHALFIHSFTVYLFMRVVIIFVHALYMLCSFTHSIYVCMRVVIIFVLSLVLAWSACSNRVLCACACVCVPSSCFVHSLNQYVNICSLLHLCLYACADKKRRMAIDIFMSRSKMNARELRHALMENTLELLSEDMLHSLKRCISPTDVRAVMDYRKLHPEARLAAAENVLVVLAEVHDFIPLIHFSRTFSAEMDFIMQQLELVESAVKSIRASSAFKTLLETILACGVCQLGVSL